MSVPPLEQFSVKRFRAGAPSRQWLVDKIIPLGCAGLLAAQGDTGKGMMMLDLALKVAGPASIPPPTAFGREVAARGGAVVLCGEDEEDEVHRRLDALDPGSQRRPLCKDFYIIPTLSLERPIIVTERHEGLIQPSADWFELEGQLARVPNLKLVVFDPLHSFTRADLTRDPIETATVMAMFAQLANHRRCSVIVTHHLSKRGGGIADVQQARDAVRGSGALVDALRWVYVLWPLPRDQALRAQRRYAIDDTAKLPDPVPDTWYGGALVKANAPSAREPAVWQRDAATRLLRLCDERDQTILIKQARDAMLEAVAKAWDADRPFQRQSRTEGLWARKAELAPVIRGLGQRGVLALCEELIDRGQIKICRPQGEGRVFWLRPAEAKVTPLGKKAEGD